MTQASARTPWNWESPALIQHWLEAGVRALIELVRNLLELRHAQIVIPGAAKRRPGTHRLEWTSEPDTEPTGLRLYARNQNTGATNEAARAARRQIRRIPREGGGPAGERSSPQRTPEIKGETPPI